MRLGLRLTKQDWPLLVISALVLLVYVYYTLSFILLVPYPGFVISGAEDGWRIVDSAQTDLAVDDIITDVDGVAISDYQSDALRVPFAGHQPGDEVSLTIGPDEQAVVFTMPVPTSQDRWRRILQTLNFWPFWVAGTAVLLFLRPRDRRWRLLVTFMYLISLWIVAGSLSIWRVGGSRLLMGLTSWLMVPVFLDVHSSVPVRRFRVIHNWILPGVYLAAILLGILEILQAMPRTAVQFGYLTAIAGSFVLLIYRFAHSVSASEQIATRLMLTGIGLAFGPGIVLVSLPNLLQFSTSGIVGITLAALSIPALPLFYVYAIYKRQLGQLEFRANRLLSIYSFILLYPTVFLLFFFFGWQGVISASGRMVYLLVISIVFVVTAPPLMARFQRLVNRLAYASEHDPDDIIRVFAHQIPSVRSREALVELIARQIVPTLLIRQSALGLFEGDNITYLYEQNMPADVTVRSRHGAKYLLSDAPVYRAPLTEPVAESDWVRLVLPLQTREETIGIWLLGKRDPDDFYPRDDIDLLQILANQIATVIENIRLYETLRGQADSLAEQVAVRTGELRAERDRTQAILDNAGEGVFFADLEGTILYVNPTMTRLTGYKAEEMLGQPLQLWSAPDVDMTRQEEMWQALRNGQAWSGEMVQRRKDNVNYDVNLSISPLQTAEGDLSGFVGVQSDISKLKEIDRLKTNIIANVSHELKTPLTNISLYLALLRRDKSGRADDYLTVLERESKRLTHLIQNLLDLSKLDTGTIPTHLAAIDLSSSVARTVATFQSLAQDKEISLACELPANLPPVIADDTQIEQVLTNLVGNALNYTPNGGHVNVSAGTASHADTPAIYIQVSDSGVGIEPADIPHLFDRFFRGAATSESNVPGTGLGLAICKEIVDRHQGHIVVESEPGRGATFTVWLPVTNGQIDEAPVPTTSSF